MNVLMGVARHALCVGVVTLATVIKTQDSKMSATTLTSTSGASEGPTIPSCIQWSREEVANWVEEIGFKQYRVGTLRGPGGRGFQLAPAPRSLFMPGPRGLSCIRALIKFCLFSSCDQQNTEYLVYK